MNTPLKPAPIDPESQFARRLAARLDHAELSHEAGERLRVARQQAVARRKMAPATPAPAVLQQGHTAVLGGWWARIGMVVPLLALVVGLIAISSVQDERRARELAEVDAALLTGELPPDAYTDPGFTQFLKRDNSTVN